MTWGPGRRRAAVSILFEGLKGSPGSGHTVTPALPVILRVLSDNGIRATFIPEPEVIAAEPFAATMIENSGNELTSPGSSVKDVGGVDQQTQAPDPASPPHLLHPAMQVAIAENLEAGRHLALTFLPFTIERPDSLAVLAETLSLLSGLVRAGRIWVPVLSELGGG